MKTIRSQRHQLFNYEINNNLTQKLRRQTLSTGQWNIQLRLWSLREKSSSLSGFVLRGNELKNLGIAKLIWYPQLVLRFNTIKI